MSRLGIALVLIVGSQLAAGERSVTDLTAAIEQELENLTEVQYLDTPLNDVTTDLELRHKVNLEIDTQALADAGIDSSLPINRSLKNLPLASALDLILTGHGLTWVIHSDVLLITTAKSESKYVRSKVYPVGDLDDDPARIGGLLAQSLAPDSWRNNGGTVGAIAVHEKSKSLVITHTSRMHRDIIRLLGDLRDTADDAKKK